VARGQRKRLSARMVEDEEYQLTYERCAGIDVAKASGVVCVRLPPQRDGGRRVSVIDTVAATVPAIAALARWLAGYGVQIVSMESTSDYVRSEGA
jgi:transposase